MAKLRVRRNGAHCNSIGVVKNSPSVPAVSVLILENSAMKLCVVRRKIHEMWHVVLLIPHLTFITGEEVLFPGSAPQNLSNICM